MDIGKSKGDIQKQPGENTGLYLTFNYNSHVYIDIIRLADIIRQAFIFYSYICVQENL